MPREYVLDSFQAPANLRVDYRKELNDQQFAAVTATPGPALVIAGAGAGKTRTLTYRVAFLMEQGIPADRILLLTFTNKAAREMMRRVADLLGGELSTLWGGTFHSIGHRILRRNADQIGYRRDFTILDREDSVDLISGCIGEFFADKEPDKLFPKPEVLAEIFSMASNVRRSISKTIGGLFPHFCEVTEEIEKLGAIYVEKKRRSNVVDFDDLLTLWLRLLEEVESARDFYQRRFQFILVDEYQDTNQLQSDLIDLLAARSKNVMVVGDDAQSIYSWRGAQYENMLEFPKRYPQARVYKIELNYRSTPEILAAANAVISANIHQFPKQLEAVRKPGQKPALVPCGDGFEQAAFIGKRILELHEEGTSLREIAVLYRSHFQAMELQLELTRRNIPFAITSGIRFFEQAHIKDVSAYLKWISNRDDELAFKRLAQMLPGIGPKAAEKIWIGLREVDPSRSRAESLQAVRGAVPKKASIAWAELSATMHQVETAPPAPSDRIRLILEAGYRDYLEESYDNYRTRLEDLEQLALFAAQFENVEEFLAQLALLSNLEADEDRPRRDDDEVKLSTVHQAKGLEFEVVFLIMLCDGMFPNARALEAEDGLEEERRLFYVAMTRARNELYLTYPLIRRSGNAMGDSMQTLSQFVREIPSDLLDEWTVKSFRSW